MMPPPMRAPRQTERPKSIKELPKYLWSLIKGFFSRLFYIVSLVWGAKKSLLILLACFCVLEGFYPVITALISAERFSEVFQTTGADITIYKNIPMGAGLFECRVEDYEQ